MHYWDLDEDAEERPPDPAEDRAKGELLTFFDEHREEVFFSRQLEVRFERDFFHWITNRALRHLEDQGVLRSEPAPLEFGGHLKLYWDRRYRYYRRDAKRVTGLVSRYSAPEISGALGHHGELMVLEGLARNQFLVQGRDTREFRGRRWEVSEHDLDMIVERDGVAYGVEVKNTLSYIDQTEFRIKRRLCQHLGLRPMFAVRMLPRIWAQEVISEGGYAMILGWQLYPIAHKDLAREVRDGLGLPVDSPRALMQGTIDKFLQRHARNV